MRAGYGHHDYPILLTAEGQSYDVPVNILSQLWDMDEHGSPRG